jgi:uncharacterized protein (TIGR03435 family)
MLRLIQGAYGVTEDGVGGGPSWLESDLFDVVARLPAGATPATILPDKGRDASIFEAVDKQLGLKLELQDVPVQVLMVASVNRKPSPNSPQVATALALAAPRFEVASIRPANPNQRVQRGLLYRGGSQMQISGRLRSLIALAFQIQPNAANDKIVGLPKFADSQLWEITAKLPSTGEGAPNSAAGRPVPPPLSIILDMLSGLLIDQFDLKTHTENREVTVYAVTLGPGKLKLTKADESERTGCIPDPNAPKPFPNLWVMANCKNFTMAEFARILEQVTGFFDHPIVDATGLQGGWNYLIGFDHHAPPQPSSPNQPPGTIAGASDPGYMSPYEAVEKELGLKLVKTRRSIPVIVVDHVDEKPLE